MPNSCVVPNCKTGYRGNTDRYSVFFAPKDRVERAKWQAAIPRIDFKLKPSHVLCERHFRTEEVIREKVIKDVHGNVLLSSKLKTCRLVKGAVPSIFAGYFPYLSRTKPRNSTMSETEGRNTPSSSNNQNGDSDISEVDNDVNESLNVSPGVHLTEPSVFELLLIDESSISLPITWARNIPLFGPRVIIYTQLVTREVKDEIKPIFFKEVCVQENGCVTCSVIGHQLKKEHFLMPEGPLQSCEQLNDLVTRFDSLQICDGVTVKEVVKREHKVCVLDTLGKWRHKNCLLIRNEDAQCSMCYIIMASWRIKQRRRENYLFCSKLGTQGS